MKNQEGNSDAVSNSGAKKAYSRPTLTEFGRVRELTTGGTGPNEEDDMAMSGPDFAPMA
ncbi:lasso RiPP family leader peptide-containing protein [Halieaceae bacterium IMCC14734]|uniref:Lasso RiPP family leader peptide-containing protein n=1 Tax=Candidatus Litorirhabdus singularis TaxID=2518993 RepID=A0ABT3TEV8_9GAMM|nr:lasso RiPP family leader peptide-containing protein [Candidatus Litorirhabdus singularis]MCX2980784.1 lasso RiPP family leader peptide-containing protein [Candidatus Litorirhabdus singularis]